MNDELRDFDLGSEDPERASGPPRGPKRWPWILALVLIVLGLAAFFWLRREKAAPEPVAEPTPAAVATERETLEEKQPSLELGEVPALAQSDAWLRTIVEQISSHPQLVEWMVTPELIRGFVATVDNLAEGVNPRPHLEMAIPGQRFAVEEVDGKLYIDPKSYERFDLLVDVIESLDVEGTAELYVAIRPLLEQAYNDLGYPGERFEATLQEAVETLLAVPVVERPIEVEPKVTAYRFVDPALESLSPVEKQLLRLGPDNLERLQRKVRELARAIGLQV